MGEEGQVGGSEGLFAKVQALPPRSSVTLGKWLYLSGPFLPQLFVVPILGYHRVAMSL